MGCQSWASIRCSESFDNHTCSIVQDKDQRSGKTKAIPIGKLVNEAHKLEELKAEEREYFRECAWEKLRVAWPDFCRESESEDLE